MYVINNRLCYPTHNVVCDPEVATPDYMAVMAANLTRTSRPIAHARELKGMNNDGSWTIELPTITLEPFWSSERAERLEEIPTRILATVTLQDGHIARVRHVVGCDRSESFQPLWKSLYQAGWRVGAVKRRQCENEYFQKYDKLVEAYNARNYVDPACNI